MKNVNMKKYLNVWMLVFITNILMAGYLINTTGSLYLVLVVLAVTILPVLLARSKYKEKNSIGYGLPGILLFFAFLALISAKSCSGDSLCGLGELLYIIFIGIPALIFMIFYKIGLYFSK